MKKGFSEANTLQLNQWGIGDVLEGRENDTTHRIIIHAVGTDNFLCQWYKLDNSEWITMNDESGNTSLNHREWKWLGNVFDEGAKVLNECY